MLGKSHVDCLPLHYTNDGYPCSLQYRWLSNAVDYITYSPWSHLVAIIKDISTLATATCSSTQPKRDTTRAAFATSVGTNP